MTGGKWLRRADQLTETHMGRLVTVGEVEGTLAGLLPLKDTVTLVLIVGGARAFFELDRDADVSVRRPEVVT